MRHLLAILLLGVCVIASWANGASVPQLTDPIHTNRMLGTLSTLLEIRQLGPMSNVSITRDVGAPDAPTAAELRHLLTGAKAVAPDDELLEQWSYAPWCTATFRAVERTWSVRLYLGGLGTIDDDGGRKAAFRYSGTEVTSRPVAAEASTTRSATSQP